MAHSFKGQLYGDRTDFPSTEIKKREFYLSTDIAFAKMKREVISRKLEELRRALPNLGINPKNTSQN